MPFLIKHLLIDANELGQKLIIGRARKLGLGAAYPSLQTAEASKSWRVFRALQVACKTPNEKSSPRAGI